MTDVKTVGRRTRTQRRDYPLALKGNVFELIAEGRNDMWHTPPADGKPGELNIAAIARVAGVDHRRLAEMKYRDPGRNVMGALARAYAKVHDVTKEEALAAVLDIENFDQAADEAGQA